MLNLVVYSIYMIAVCLFIFVDFKIIEKYLNATGEGLSIVDVWEVDRDKEVS